MKYQTLNVIPHEEKTTRGQLSMLREKGKVPAVISTPQGKAEHVLVDFKELQNAVHKSGVGGVVQLKTSGNKGERLVILKEIQWEPISKKVLHVSFSEISGKGKIHANVPVVPVGEPLPVKEKYAQLIKNTETVELTGGLASLPDVVYVDISDLQLGDVVTAGDLILPEGVEARHPNTVLFSVAHVRGEVAAPEIETEVTEPELVTKHEAEKEETEE
ncbi:MAG TPA: 50S ribosomal protein L25 [Fimbriimonadales bacterium]|nr:50S ribosomal protein L25 [Fimbriimonadales bacterium]